jgi:hypothetical protein
MTSCDHKIFYWDIEFEIWMFTLYMYIYSGWGNMFMGHHTQYKYSRIEDKMSLIWCSSTTLLAQRQRVFVTWCIISKQILLRQSTETVMYSILYSRQDGVFVQIVQKEWIYFCYHRSNLPKRATRKRHQREWCTHYQHSISDLSRDIPYWDFFFKTFTKFDGQVNLLGRLVMQLSYVI